MSILSEMQKWQELIATATYSDGTTVTCVTDPNATDTPCVFLPVPKLSFSYQNGCAKAEMEAFIISNPSTDFGTQTEQISKTLDALLPLATATPVQLVIQSGELYQLTLSSGTTATAYRLTWQARLKIGD